MMWPSYFLLNKILKTDDEEEEEGGGEGNDGDHMNMAAGCSRFDLPSDDRNGGEAASRRSRFVRVPHINQLFSWDCGLACVLMVLTTVGVNDCSLQKLAELCHTTSIWTVDLAYLLQKFSVRFSYYTVTFGANPNYSRETYYKEHLPSDQVRVDKLFQKAVGAGIKILCRSIRIEEISRWILSGKYIAILLVDLYKLSRSWVGDVIIHGFQGNDVGYTGHYVVLCGYDVETDEFEIRDPASSRKQDRISSQSLEEARKSFGTDEDLLLISVKENRKQEFSVF